MPVEWCCGWGVRHIQVSLLVCCGMIQTSMLQSMKISIYLINSDQYDNYTLFDDPYRQAVRHYTMEQRSFLLSAWLVLSFTGSLIGGYLTLFVNLKYLLMSIVAVTTVITYLIPQAVINSDYNVVLALIIFSGFVHAFKDPTVVALLAHWTPHTELGRSVSLVFSSSVLSFILGLMIYGFLESSPSSWVTVYYLMANTGVLWCVSWYAFGCHDPNKCFYASAKEKTMLAKYITKSPNTKKTFIPWPLLFKSVPFYGLLISKVCDTWIFVLLFYTTFFQSNLFARGTGYSFKVYILILIGLMMIPLVQFIIGTIGDNLIKSNFCPSRYVRKTFNSIALWGQSVCCLFLSYKLPALGDIVFYIIFSHLGALTFQGSLCTFFDMERRCSGFVFGLVNFFARIPVAFVCSYSSTIMRVAPPGLYESQLRSHFVLVYTIGALCLFLGNFFYIIMTTDENDPMLPIPTDEHVDEKK